MELHPWTRDGDTQNHSINIKESSQNEEDKKVRPLRQGVRRKERNAALLLRTVPGKGQGGKEAEAARVRHRYRAGHRSEESGLPHILKGGSADGLLAPVHL